MFTREAELRRAARRQRDDLEHARQIIEKVAALESVF